VVLYMYMTAIYRKRLYLAIVNIQLGKCRSVAWAGLDEENLCSRCHTVSLFNDDVDSSTLSRKGNPKAEMSILEYVYDVCFLFSNGKRRYASRRPSRYTKDGLCELRNLFPVDR